MILNSAISVDGIHKAAGLRQINLSPHDEHDIHDALMNHNGTMTLAQLIGEIPNVKIAALKDILAAVANS